MPPSGSQRSRKWVSGVNGGTGALIAQCLVLLMIVNDRADAISYRKDTGFATDGKDQFVFRAPEATSADPRPGTVISFQAQDVKRAGRVRFLDSSEQHRSDSGPFFAPSSSATAPNAVPFYNRDQGGDKFYTVGASIQFAGAGGDTITPPPPPPPPPPPSPDTAGYQQKVKRKKNKFKYASQKVYNVAGGQEQDQYVPFGAPLHDNYLTGPAGAQYDQTIANYPELQTQQYPFSMNSHYPGAYGYNGQQGSVGGLYQQYPQPQYPSAAYQSPYAPSSPYRPPYQGGSAPYYQQPQPSSGTQPPNAQSILGVLQSIFNFAPGTFGGSGAQTFGVNRPAYAPNPTPIPGFSGGVGGQLRQALDNIADNDELQCVPKLICMMSRSSTGQGFSSSVNRGLLSTILGAVPDSSPWLKFSRAALLGYGIGANSCDAYYPKCPKDEMQILYYLNNHRGGFFRFFNNGDQQPQQYG
ncbi:trithorax group protein osa [Anopheles bellator]|uniref:trithorax group protein osa n=1 Tax=Anopheles bellator TaxID=139047 RepID=UPI00264A29BD|nr:trithorax group protein osa [Anopheles bellator]